MKLSTTCILVLSVIFLLLSACGTYSAADELNKPTGINLSKQLLEAKKARKEGQDAVDGLANLDASKLLAELDSKQKQLAFWINVYNGMVQYLLVKDSTLWESRNNFFSEERFIIAGESLSLEDVEHGIIRGGENKLGLGYIPQLFPNKFKKSFRIDGGDGRVHFALNCGAIDCPPVEIYEPTNIEQRLDHRSKTYVSKHTIVDDSAKTFTTSPLFSWFRGDFKAYGGINDFLVRFGALSETQKDYNRSFKNYDWTLATDVWAKD